MVQIGLMSDTHSYLDPKIFDYFDQCDEIWHAGDIGTLALADKLAAFKPLRAVFGNIDNKEIQLVYPLDLHFEIEGLTVYITHIGGYPSKYTPRVKNNLDVYHPRLYICGHSHILKIMPDKPRNLIHMNPGACGNQGIHQVKTLIRFKVELGKIFDVEVIELGSK
jgi:uncharacterized protein